jgi:hypothetical protein
MDEDDNFVCQFPNPWALRVLGKDCYTSKCEKVKITAPFTSLLPARERGGVVRGQSEQETAC